MSVQRVIVIGPQFDGADGLSELSRQVALALSGPARVVVRTLANEAAPRRFAGADIAFVPTARAPWRLALAALTLAERGDLVVVMHAHLLSCALPALVRGARVATVLVGIEAWKPFSPLQRFVLSRSTVVSISRHTVERFRAANPKDAGRPIEVCYPSVPPAEPPRESGLQPGFALMVGRMSAEERYKGHDAVLEAWPVVRAACAGARLVIVGDGDDRDRLQAGTAAAGLSAAVEFLGRVDAARLQGLYRDARFFVMPSRNEGFGLVYLEAMRAGLPCVASPGSAAEILEDGREGLMVAADDVKAIAAACTRLFTDRDLCARLGSAARDRVAERFEFARFRSRLRSVLPLEEPSPC
jgi:phosphatidylinositol alpha-1,6-mannosyltransferase